MPQNRQYIQDAGRTARPVRVCCFCESWESGGIESFLKNVLCRIGPEKVEVDLVAGCLKDSIFTAPMQAHGVRFRELSGSQRRVLENHRLFRRLLRERQYDIVHLHLFHGLSLYYAHLAKKAGVPVRIAHSHNTDLRRTNTKPLKLLVHRLAKQLFERDVTDFWACSSQAAAFLFSRKAASDFRWIPNGIRTERFRFDPVRRGAVRERLGLGDAFVVGNIGRLCTQKNQSFLLEVFAELVRRWPESRLLLVGAGEKEAMLREKAERLAISDRTIFFGVTDRVEELLWAMDLFVLPSLFEGLAITVVEAQSAGLPVVCSEQITEEAMVTPLVRAVPLSGGAARWAEECLSWRPEFPREAGCRMVREAGFQIDTVARQIEESYLRLSTEQE